MLVNIYISVYRIQKVYRMISVKSENDEDFCIHVVFLIMMIVITYTK